MKSGRSIQDVSREILRQQEAKADYDRATKLEEIGYSVMTMSPMLLQKINQAQVTRIAA